MMQSIITQQYIDVYLQLRKIKLVFRSLKYMDEQLDLKQSGTHKFQAFIIVFDFSALMDCISH